MWICTARVSLYAIDFLVLDILQDAPGKNRELAIFLFL
jgi:hypothetical protein